MEFTHLELTDFRNYHRAEIDLSPGLNLVVGGNGQGKTNLLEAIHLLCAHGSHRSSTLAPLIRDSQESSIIRGTAQVAGREMSVDAEIRRSGGLRVLVNKLSSPVSSGPAAIIFSPEDLAILKGGPEERRRMLDQAAAMVRPRASADRQEFERVLRQRNGVLKASFSNPRALKTLGVWDEQLARAGAALVAHRLEVLGAIRPAAEKHYQRLAGAQVPEFHYSASWRTREGDDLLSLSADLAKALEDSHSRDLERGVSTVGPHRDDLAIELDGADARTHASQGEQRTLALSLRLAQRDLVASVRDEDPVLLLDDVFSELDRARRSELGSLVAASGQAIATTTGVEGISASPAAVVRVEGGRVWRDD